jgi:hypothetical protein
MGSPPTLKEKYYGMGGEMTRLPGNQNNTTSEQMATDTPLEPRSFQPWKDCLQTKTGLNRFTGVLRKDIDSDYSFTGKKTLVTVHNTTKSFRRTDQQLEMKNSRQRLVLSVLLLSCGTYTSCLIEA